MIIKILSEPNKKSFWTAVLWTILIFFLSFKSSDSIPKINISNLDKVVHFTFYFVFVFLWYRFLFFKKWTHKKYLIGLVVVSISFGICVELGQGFFTTTRQPDVVDAFANTIGSLFGIFIATSILKQEKA